MLISSTLIINFSFTSAESNTAGEFYLLQKQGQIINSEDFEYISGVSPHEMPFFMYRIEGYDSLGNYFFGASETTLSVSLIPLTNGDLWEWKIPIFHNGECSCRVHISQLDSAYNELEKYTLAIWIKSENTDQNQENMALSYPIFVPDVHYPTSNILDFKQLEFSNQVEIFADIYYPNEMIANNSNFDGGMSINMSDYLTSGADYHDDSSLIFTTQTELEEGKHKIHFSMSLENYTEGLYLLDINFEIFSRWDVKYVIEIDRTFPIALIDADDTVEESLEWVYVNASGSFDPESILDISFQEKSTQEIFFDWIIEGPDGTISAPNENMIVSPNQLRFLPLNEGRYVFTIIVTDVAGNVNQTSHIINVENVVPIGIICDSDDELIDYSTYYYNSSEINMLSFNAYLSTDSINEIEDLQFGWYLDGVLHSSENLTVIDLEDIGPKVELELIVKDNDGDSDVVLLILKQFDVGNTDSNDMNFNSNFINGLNLVLLTAFLCVIILLFVKKKSIEENPLPKWSKYNKKQ